MATGRPAPRKWDSTVATQKKISLEELRARLVGNGLVTEGEGVFRADHILIAPRVDGTFVLRAIGDWEEGGRKVIQRLRAQLADVANVEFQAAPNPLRSAS